MNRNEATAVVISMVLIVLSSTAAQSPTPNAPAGASAKAPAVEPRPSRRAKRVVAPPSDADARHCLELPTNPEVVACAEKYRAR